MLTIAQGKQLQRITKGLQNAPMGCAGLQSALDMHGARHWLCMFRGFVKQLVPAGQSMSVVHVPQAMPPPDWHWWEALQMLPMGQSALVRHPGKQVWLLRLQ